MSSINVDLMADPYSMVGPNENMIHISLWIKGNTTRATNDIGDQTEERFFSQKIQFMK